MITGISAIVQTAINKAVLLLPNARQPLNEHAAGMHIVGHVPFLQWASDANHTRVKIAANVALTSLECLASVFADGNTTVLILTDATLLNIGVELQLFD